MSNSYLNEDSYYNPYPNFTIPNYSQIPNINLCTPQTQYNPYCASQYNFYQQPMISTNQFSYMISPTQTPSIYQPQFLQQPPSPYFIQPFLPPIQIESKKSKPKKKSHKKSEKKSLKDTNQKPPKPPKSKKVSKRKKKVDKKLIFTKSFSGDAFDGIFSELNKKCHSNCHKEGVIQISGNIYHNISIIGDFSSLVDYEEDSVPAYDSEDVPNSYLLFDFKENLVKISAYSIKATDNPDPSYFTSWIVEGSTDNVEWTIIDTHSDDQRLVGRNKIDTFLVKDQNVLKKKFRYIRMKMIGMATSDNYYFEMRKIEFFGSYYEK